MTREIISMPYSNTRNAALPQSRQPSTTGRASADRHSSNTSSSSNDNPFTVTMDSAMAKDSRFVSLRNGLSGSASSKCLLIGSRNACGAVSCPCCNRTATVDGRQTVGQLASVAPPYGSLLDRTDESDDVDRMLPGILSEGVPYTVTNVLVQGWVHKKGSGHDWMGSTAWKPRWAVLAMARVDGCQIEVPLLLIYWYATSTAPSSVIMLDSTVVLSEDAGDDTEWNCHRFKICHAKPSTSSCSNKNTGNNSTDNITRVFACPKDGRDAWAWAINHALLQYEKNKQRASARPVGVRSPLRMHHTLAQDIFPSGSMRFSPSAKQPRSTALSPPSSPSRPIPVSPHSSRYALQPDDNDDTLLGESFLVDDVTRTAYE